MVKGGKEWERVGKSGKGCVCVRRLARARELHLFACTYLAGYDDGEVVGELEESEVEDVEERRRVASFEPAPPNGPYPSRRGEGGGGGGGEGVAADTVGDGDREGEGEGEGEMWTAA